MKKVIGLIALVLAGSLSATAQTTDNMDRIEVCKQNYRTLFGGEALTGQGTDLEMMDILQLTTLEAESQLHSHYHGNINAGNSPETLTAAVIQCLPYIGALHRLPRRYQGVAHHQAGICQVTLK